MKNETITVDDIECPYCGRVFDGGMATNYDTTCDFINCPTCDGEIEVLQSVTYTCHPVNNQTDIQQELRTDGERRARSEKESTR